MIPVPRYFKSPALSNLPAGASIGGANCFFPVERDGAIRVLQTLNTKKKIHLFIFIRLYNKKGTKVTFDFLTTLRKLYNCFRLKENAFPNW